MSAERIPACALCLSANASSYLAEAIGECLRNPDVIVDASLKKAWDASSDAIRPRWVDEILGGQRSEWDMEAYHTAVLLHRDACDYALRARELWDGRKTDKTRRELLCVLTSTHIVQWIKDRGLDSKETARLVDRVAELMKVARSSD